MDVAGDDWILSTGRDAMDDSIRLLVTGLGELDDPRQAAKVTYPLSEMALVTVAAIVADCDGWDDVAEFGRDRLEWLQQFLPFEQGIPSHDTFARVFSVVDVESLEACVSDWVAVTFMQRAGDSCDADGSESETREVVAVDGKTMRRSHDRARNESPLHVVSAWASTAGVSLGQTAVAEKSNEITAIPALVRLLSLTHCIVTIDAMGCQKEIARVLRAAQADYVLAVKGNQPSLQQAVIQFFEQMEQHESAGVEFQHRETLDEQRSRRERRLYWTVSARAALTEQDDWTDLQTIGMVISERTVNDRTSREVRYYISSLENDVTEFSRAVRAHWSIENSLHWRLDVVFREDESRMRIGHSARVFTLFRKVAINLLNHETSRKQSLRSKRKRAARNTEYLLKVLTSV